MTKTVYLAGPISGCSYDEATDWREQVARRLLPGISAVSPMRMKEWCKTLGAPILGVEQYREHLDKSTFLISGEGRAIAMRDFFDVRTVDMVLAYLPKELNDRRPSWGTAAEIGYAIRCNTPIVLVTDDEALVAHPLYRETIGWIVQDMELAATIVNTVLDPYL